MYSYAQQLAIADDLCREKIQERAWKMNLSSCRGRGILSHVLLPNKL